MTKWMISANGNIYDHASAFAKWGYIDWRQRANYAVGDIVYIYCTRPFQRVMYKAIVQIIDIPFDAITNDKEFWYDLDEYQRSTTERYARLKLIEQADREELSLPNLQQYGLKSAPQGPIKISSELASFIDNFLVDEYEQEFFPESSFPEGSFEGATKTTTVNRYERSSIARQRCIQHYGCKCYICGFDFENKYGEIGKGFIHVHHIVPLNEIGKQYVVNYETDLIPVCPNCHAMLHRTLKGKSISIEDLKIIVKNNT